METNEKQMKIDGNDRKRGDLRIHMKVQQIETNMQKMREQRSKTHKNATKMTNNGRCSEKQRKHMNDEVRKGQG